MTIVRFISADGNHIQQVSGAPGERLLDLAQAHGLPLEGTCEGQMACSTCHVIVDPEWFERLPAAVEDEEDMLDLAAGVTRTSRLSCQIVLAPELDGLEARIPGESRDMQSG
jgi:ferredoxin